MPRRLYNSNPLGVITWALDNAQTDDAASSVDQFSLDDRSVQSNTIPSHQVSTAEEFDTSIPTIEEDLEESLRPIEIDSTSQHSNEGANYDLVAQGFSTDIDDALSSHTQQNAQEAFGRLDADIAEVNSNQDELDEEMGQIFSRRNRDMETGSFTSRSADISDSAVEEPSLFDSSPSNLEENDHRDEDSMVEQENDEEEDANLYIHSSDHDILQDPHPLTFRNLLEDLEATDSEGDFDSSSSASSSSFAPSRPPSTPYVPSIPRGSPSPTPSFEVVVRQGGKDILPPSLHMALGLWFEKSGGSRTDYVRLREILQLAKPSADDHMEEETEVDPISLLPLKLDTLKSQIRRHMPLLTLHRRALKVVIEKQPSLAAKQKGRTRRERIERLSWHYWYEPHHLIRTILSATKLREKMHFGMADIVDEPTELWHSPAWGSSIRTVSGDVCYTQQGQLIIPGDILSIRTSNITDSSFTFGRVIFIGRDKRKDALETGKVIVTLQAVVFNDHPILKDFDLSLNDINEAFILEDTELDLELEDLEEHFLIHLDRDYTGETNTEDVYLDDRYFIRRVLNSRDNRVRPLCQMHQTRGELEIEHFDREQLAEAFSRPHISFPYLLFIDDFGVHRNMYRALKAFYLIPACLSYSERRKVANVFTLTLGPHGAQLKDVVEAFRKPLKELDTGLEMNINGQDHTVCASVMAFLGDMPQQADNGGFSRHNAERGCRTCLCPKSERGNLEYDIIGNGRYHSTTERDRESAQYFSGKDQKLFVQNTGIKIDASPITSLAPALDIILSRAYDAPHSEWRGLGRILQNFLLTAILSKKGSTAYLKAFQSFPFPPGWPRIQSPNSYIYSWSLSEAGRATVLTPLILRKHATISWFRLSYLQGAERVFNAREAGTTSIRAIVKAFGVIALANTLVGSQRESYHGKVHQVVLEGRQAYKNLIHSAMRTAEGFGIQEARENGENEEEGEEGEAVQIDEEVVEARSVELNAGMGDNGSDGMDELNNDDAEEALLVTLSAAGESGESDMENQVLGDRDRTRGRKPSANKYQKLLLLPNLHAGLHLSEMAREYATVMNLNVLPGEMKHMIFKAMADQAAPPNLMGYLFSRDVMTQSIRLGLAGAWDHHHPELMQALHMVDNLCPSLVQSFLPTGEQTIKDDNDTAHTVVGDRQHLRAQLSNGGFELRGELSINNGAKLMKLPPQHPFLQQLLHAYEVVIGRRIVDLGRKPLRWYRRLAFNDQRNRRHIYNTGDFMVFGNKKARLAQCFLHEYRNRRYGFVVVDVLQRCFIDSQPLQDPVLDLPVYKYISNQRIYPLSSVSPRTIYLIDAPEEPDWQLEEGTRYLLHCTWGVDYL